MGDTNTRNNDIAIIRDTFGLSEAGYKIICKNSFYVIQLRKHRQSRIAAIMDANIFRRYNLEFRNCVFDDLCFINEIIDKKIRFQNCTFKKCTLDRCIFEDFVNFNFGNLSANCEGDFVCTDTIFKDIAYFIKLTFKGNVDFSRSYFKERAFFSESTFNNEANFSEVIFDHNAYFDEAEFLGEANFSLSEFYENAHFYGTRFNKISQGHNITMSDIPNFLQTILNGYINFTNTKQLLLNFEQLKSIIDGNNEKKKHELANEFRNTFRNFKNALIKDNNLIDASQFHKMELYAKELEMNYKKEKATKDWIEKIHLMLYRLTSDHHTDLLLILNNMLALIVLFGTFVYGLCCFASHDKIKENGAMTNYFCFECDMGNIVCCEVLLILALCLAFVIVFMLMVGMFYYINTRCKHLGRWFVVIFLANAFILAIKPAIMLPIFGKLIDDSLNKIDFPAFTSLSVVYAILMFLLIWSLQKTARKNTIVPN